MKSLFTIVRCPNLPDPFNGRVNQRGNNPGDRASYTCNSGYELQGDSTRTCQNNGQWSGDAPTCEREGMRNAWLVDCKQLLHLNLLQFGAPPCPTHPMEELVSKATDLEQGQLMSATVAMSLLVNLQDSAKITGSGLEMHQLVKVSLTDVFGKIIKINFYQIYSLLPWPSQSL